MSQSQELFKALFVPFPEEIKKTKTIKGSTITFVEWHSYVARAHAVFPQGYSKDVRVTQAHGQTVEEQEDGSEITRDVDTLIVIVRITDNETGEYHEALGAADASKSSWGGAIAEAESQATRRAFANWGLGLEMYMDDEQFAYVRELFSDGPSEIPEEGYPGDADEDDPLDGAVTDDKITPPGPATDRQVEVIKVIGGFLTDYSNKHLDGQLANFLDRQRSLIDPLTRRTAGVAVRQFREKLEELGLDDPTKADDAS